MNGDFLFHREGQELEFKEQFNFAGLADYYKDFGAFANNRGGYLIFGVQDAPRVPIGMNDNSIDQFEKIDAERISRDLLEIFSSDILWDQATLSINDMTFGIFRIYEAISKPVIAKKNEGANGVITNGDIYRRYGGRTQKILYAELEALIRKRLEDNDANWRNLLSKMGSIGPKNATVIDTEKSLVANKDSRTLVIDADLAKKIKFIKEGQFSEKEGAGTLKLIGDVVPVERVDVVQMVKEDLLKQYPISATQLAQEVKKSLPNAKMHQIWNVISENDLKNKLDYSAYVFSNEAQREAYEATGKVRSGTTSIYNQNAVGFVIDMINSE